MKLKSLLRNNWFRGAALLFLLVLILVGRPAFHLTKAIWNDVDDTTAPPPGTFDDASRLNQTRVAEVWKIPTDTQMAEQQLAELLRRAQAKHLTVSIAGARHSMGGHTISPDGIVIDMLPFHQMQWHEAENLLWVQAGARWSEVITYLNRHGRSPEIMQSNNDFSVGGSLSANCHGWQFDRPPIASSVDSFRLMKADGTIVKCSRTENRELFSLALGGYGLFGIILDANLRVVPNETYQAEKLFVSTVDYAQAVRTATEHATNVAMVYGRLRVTPDHFLAEGIINVLRRHPGPNPLITTLTEPKHATFMRAVFRGSADSDYGKRLRWNAERNLNLGDTFQRNALLSVPVSLFQDRSSDSTDILMECFVSPTNFEAFLGDLRKIIPATGADLLNITVRHVNRDNDTVLSYATDDMFALVMLFNQKRDSLGEEKMKKTAQEIIDAAIRHHGGYYLPYRLHATPQQFATAYPDAEKFFTLKRRYDPEELFQNTFYRTYGIKTNRLSGVALRPD